MTNTNHGGKRKGAGRPVTGKHDSTVIRVDTALVPFIDEIRGKYKEASSVDDLINVTDNQDRIKALETELALLRDQALNNPPKQWVKSNFGVADGTICSKVALSAKKALGFTKDDYSHNHEINTWLSLRSPTEIETIIKEAKAEISSKRKKSYSEAKRLNKK